MKYPLASRPSEDPSVLAGQLSRELKALLDAADADNWAELVSQNRWEAYALQATAMLTKAAGEHNWTFAEKLVKALEDWRVLSLAELIGNDGAAVRFGVVGVAPVLNAYLSVIEQSAAVMSEFAFRDFLKTRDGRSVLETLRSLDAEPRRWLTVDEVGERNRYAHQTADIKWLGQTLSDLLERGLVQRLYGRLEDAPETARLDIMEVGHAVRPLYAITQAGYELALELAAVGCDEIETF